MSVATEDSLIPASSSSFSSRCASRLRSRVMTVRVRVRSRNSRIGGGGTNEARTNPCAQIRQPRSIGDIALAARHIPGVAGVDQHHVQAVVEKVVERLPIGAGGLHHHTRDLLGEQMLPQREDLETSSRPRRHCRRCPSAPMALNPHTDLRVFLREVDSRAPRVHYLHRIHRFPTGLTKEGRASGRAG